MENNLRLTQITDVGAADGNGVDSTWRIMKQYQALGVQPEVISAGHSPLQVAFVACAELSAQAGKNAAAVLEKLALPKPLRLPLALNSAPRNSAESQGNGKEDHIFRVKFTDGRSVVIYGPEVLRWVLEFENRAGVIVERILAINGVIEDTSVGSQFRSAEHLPIVHFLEAQGSLDQFSTRENIDIEQMGRKVDWEKCVVVAPPDEYANGRLIIARGLLEKISVMPEISIPSLSGQALVFKRSLTEVVPGELSVWLSSNHFPNSDLVVLNVGTRWKPNSSRTTDLAVLELAQHLSENVGQELEIRL